MSAKIIKFINYALKKTMNKKMLSQIIDFAISEDIKNGDITSLSCIPATAEGKMKLLVKEKGVLAGLEVAEQVFKQIDSELKIEKLIADGSEIKPGDVAFYVQGKVISLLAAERLVLNIMQRMSGIATQTKVYVDKLQGLKTKVLDTRKTTPGVRILEKEAVRLGGGTNHRMGLYDMVMIKDNHIDFAGGIKKAIEAANKYIKENNLDVKIEVEARSFEEIREIMEVGNVDIIMIDNFTPADTVKALEMINGKYETESSGGITLETIRNYAECGVDYISVGALTHQIKSLDLSLKAVNF